MLLMHADGCWRMGDGCWDTTDLSCGETRGALRQRKMPGCGKTRPLWWQGTREAAFGRLHTEGAAAFGGRPPFVAPLFLASTEVLPCRNRHLVLPQRTSRLPTREIGRVPASITHPPASISIHQHASCIKHHAACILDHPSCMIMHDHA